MCHQSRRGSLSLEALVCAAMILFVVLFFLREIYTNRFLQKGYEHGVEAYLAYNDDYVDDKVIMGERSNVYLHAKDLVLRSLSKKKLPLAFEAESGWMKSSQIVYVTDTGSCYHRLSCPSARLSIHALWLEEAKKSYSPCSICNP